MITKKRVLYSILVFLLSFMVGYCWPKEEVQGATVVTLPSAVEQAVIKYILTPAEEEAPTYYDVALSEELQDHLFNECAAYGVEPRLALAVMQTESGFREHLISSTNDYGLMQINKSNHSWLADEIGVVNFLDPYQNITAGVYMLSRYTDRYDMTKTLMCYNMGEGGASKAWRKGITETKYSKKVIENYNSLEFKEMTK